MLGGATLHCEAACWTYGSPACDRYLLTGYPFYRGLAQVALNITGTCRCPWLLLAPAQLERSLAAKVRLPFGGTRVCRQRVVFGLRTGGLEVAARQL